MHGSHRGGAGLKAALKLTIVVAVLGASAAFYWVFRSMEHFLWHVGYGAAAGLFVGTIVGISGRPVRPWLWGLGGYGFMVVPDLLWLLGLIATGSPWHHQRWMDVFVFHVSLDSWPPATAFVLPTYVAACLLIGLTPKKPS